MSKKHSNPPCRGPVVLCILDGWGERLETENNAIALAQTPNWDNLVKSVPKATLDASAEQVGLPAGQMGNSEVGHMNLGAGRIVMQDILRIDAAIDDGSIAENVSLLAYIKTIKETGGTCHLMGLMSPGGVHSHQNHIVSLAKILGKADIPTAIHAFTDGRDTPPKMGGDYLSQFIKDIEGLDKCQIATVTGRYYALDRDNRWDRIEQAYNAMAKGIGKTVSNPLIAISDAYEGKQTDEFILPNVIGDYGGMKNGDGILMSHFRADRSREILASLIDPDFDGFKRNVINFSAKLGMVEYSDYLSEQMGCMFSSSLLSGILGEVVANAGLKQLRIAETEKYAHVTFFLNGGREAVFEGEERILISSPKVSTYDLQPEMSAPELTDKLVDAISSGEFGLIIVNYANGDMVGHTGILEAAIKAVQTLDNCLGRLEEAILVADGTMFVTADHGNCESMFDAVAGEPHTQHTLNVVPSILVNGPDWVRGLKAGRLCDVAPTLLQLMGLVQPIEMTGCSLLDVNRLDKFADE
jgi:2,3-bisphosphoglycerate-independent phosphoglycerate mutase